MACIGREGEEMCNGRLERNENVNTELLKASSWDIVSSCSGFEDNSFRPDKTVSSTDILQSP